MKRIFLALTVCFLLPSCGLFGSDGDGRCDDGREGLFIQTDRDAYQVGEEATLAVENCTGSPLYVEKNYTVPPDYHIEKQVAGEWRLASARESPSFRTVKVELGDRAEFALPVEPYEDFLDSIPGTYRYELDIYAGQQVEDKLPKEERVSNTFEITE